MMSIVLIIITIITSGGALYYASNVSNQVKTVSEDLEGVSDSLQSVSESVVALSDTTLEIADKVGAPSPELAALAERLAALEVAMEEAREEPKEYIVFGRSLAFTGKYTQPALMAHKGWELWIKLVNEEGGIYVKEYGKKLLVKCIYYDDESDPATAAELYRKLIEVDKVDLLVGPYASAVNYAVQSIAESYGYMLPITEGTSTSLYTRGMRYSFMCGPGGVATYYSYPFMEWLSTLPEGDRPTKVAVLAEDTAFPISVYEGVIAQSEEFGFEVVYQELYPKGTTDYVPMLTAAKDAGADLLMGGTYFPDAAGIVRAAKEVDFNPKAILCTVGPTIPEWGPELGADGDWVFSSSDWDPSAPTFGNEEMISRFREEYGTEPDYHTARDFACGQIMEAAIMAQGTLDNDELLDHILQTSFDTVIGKLSLGNVGDLTNVAWPPGYVIVQWQDGEVKVVIPSEAATADPAYPTPTWDERP
jgi:branched-chain amino acid transport system substrate-binding protein